MTSKNLPRLTTSTTQPTSEYFFKPKTSDGTKYLFVLYRLAGILPPNRFKTVYTIYSFVLNVVVIIFLPPMYVLSYVLRSEEWQELQELLSSLESFLGVAACELKFVAIICLRDYLFKIETILEKLDARIQNTEEIYEVERINRFNNRIMIVFTIFYNAFTTSSLIGAICTGRTPFSLYIPYLNWRKSAFDLALSGAIEYILLSGAILQALINDTVAIIYTGILQSHLKILIMKVSRIGTDPRCTQDDNLKELVRCIHDHKNIIELINAIDPVISATYFIQFLLTTACLGATLININIFNDNSTLVGSVVYGLCLIIQILPMCFIANGLAADSDRLPEAIFHMNWMDQSLEFQRLCLFFMHRSQETIVFYAGKMIPISLNTFVSIIKFTFSVYTLLDNMNFAERFNY